MKAHERLANEAVLAFHRGDKRTSADKYLASFLSSPSKWTQHRWYILHGYTSILREKYFPPTTGDFDALDSIASDKSEPKLYRSEAAWTIGILRWDARERIEAADQYRRAIRYAERADGKERRRRVMTMTESGVGEKTVGKVIDENMDLVRSNLAILERSAQRINTLPDIDRTPVLRSDGTTMERDIRGGAVVVPDVDPERLAVGGNRCDACRRGIDDLKLRALKRCGRCQMAFYCSSECQKSAWRAGHKEACRKPGQFEPGDHVMLKGLKSKSIWNGWVVQVVGPTDDREGRWTVQIFQEGRTVSVAANNIEHIRPPK